MDDKKKIYNDMMSDPKIQDTLKSSPKPESLDEMAVVLGGLAAGGDYPLSKDDIRLILADCKKKTDETAVAVGKLPDSDLSAVAGGKNAANYICQDTYKDKENCWFNDGCDFAVNWYPYYICKRNEAEITIKIEPWT